ncbi:MAG: toll/interleukin-1 receptor domain-containing protein [Nitrososphaera sp.]
MVESDYGTIYLLADDSKRRPKFTGRVTNEFARVPSERANLAVIIEASKDPESFKGGDVIGGLNEWLEKPELKCFISYSTQYEKFCEQLYVDLKLEGVDCWMWNKNVRPGHDLPKAIETALRDDRALLFVCGKSSLESDNVIREIWDKLMREGKSLQLIPVMLDDFLDQYVATSLDKPFVEQLRRNFRINATAWETSADVYIRVLREINEALRWMSRPGVCERSR